ncbi:MAG: NADP oxidoreductase, partial [Candidatus Dormibacteraeota bacterium]|nr:NADP oxidoreductase [Candidatus Dormibacteraeota bacterium]
DVSNPLDFSAGFPPRLTNYGDDSTGEQIQRAFPEARVVKTLNTINCDVMVNPELAPGGNVFLSGDNPRAKGEVRELLQSFGWPHQDIVDIGDIKSSRGAEAYVLFWVRLMQAEGTAAFNIRIVRG